MRLTIGIAFGMSIVIAYWILSTAVQRLAGQEVLTLPIEKHTDNLQDAMWDFIVARPTNGPLLLMEKSDRRSGSTNISARIEFSITILSRMETNDMQTWIKDNSVRNRWFPNVTSNVIAQIVWKGKTNECVLERNP